MLKKSATIKVIIIFVFAFFLICSTLYAGKNVSLTNNGDFFRVANMCSLASGDNGDFIIAVSSDDSYLKNIGTILLRPKDISIYPSAQLIFVRLAVAINYTANIILGIAPDVYNSVYLCMMLSILYGIALTFLLLQIDIRKKAVYWLAVAVSLVIMCDIGYVSYFNSLYGEGIQHIFLVFVTGFIIKIWKKPLSIAETVFFAISLILFGQAKFFNIPVAVLLGVLSFVLLLRHCPCKKVLIISGVSTVISIAVLLLTYSALPDWISKETNYNSVFYGIVKDCDDSEAKQYLEELDLPREMYVLKDTHHYVSNFNDISEEYNIESAEDISKLKLIMFYLKHPAITLDRIRDSFNHSSHIRNIFFMDEGYMEDAARCTLWSRIREHMGFDTVVLNIIILLSFFALVTAAFLKSGTKKKLIVLSTILLAGMFAYAIFIPYVSNGEADLAKHMFLYIEFVDISLIAVMLMCIGLPSKAKIAALIVVCLVVGANMMPSPKGEEILLGGFKWQVIDENSSYKTLIAKEGIAKRQFDGDNNNFYADSDIHSWLNTEFMENFTSEEKELLYKKEEKILLSKDFVEEADSGNRDFYCSAFAKRLENNYDTAYGHTVCAYVFLPTAEHISKMAEKGYKISLKDKYWLSTPYFNSGEKTRYVNPDGLIYFDYTAEEMYIRPVICLKQQAMKK